uniref:Putative salivary lipocalin lipocalin n=1 Tax=Ixodes ricinus TaxID=34613 RepID=A0A6B0UXX1_IXORI
MKTTRFPKTLGALNTKRSLGFLRLLAVLKRESKKPFHKAPPMTRHLMKEINYFKDTKISRSFIAQTFNPHTVDGHKDKYKARAQLYRNGRFYDTRVIFTDRKRCTILRTPEYHNLCELFTAGPYTKGSLNNYCFFIYNMYCKEPAKTFTKLGDCWPPARQPNPQQ